MDKEFTVDDMLGCPYEEGGRGPDRYDCYGVVLECEKRLGHTLLDVRHDDHSLELSALIPTIGDVHPVERAGLGVIVECEAAGELHLGMALDSRNMIHATYNHGVCVHPLRAVKVRRLYGVGI